jgi:hypothetical protein
MPASLQKVPIESESANAGQIAGVLFGKLGLPRPKEKE